MNFVVFLGTVAACISIHACARWFQTRNPIHVPFMCIFGAIAVYCAIAYFVPDYTYRY